LALFHAEAMLLKKLVVEGLLDGDSLVRILKEHLIYKVFNLPAVPLERIFLHILLMLFYQIKCVFPILRLERQLTADKCVENDTG
jgi:hypothetical protein